MTSAWKAFKDGFVGSFVLAAALVMALVSVASSFVHSDIDRSPHRDSAHT